MGRAAQVIPLPEKRGLNRIEAAGYVGVSPSLFDEMVKDQRMPGPKKINSRSIWDRRRLDAAFEALSDSQEGANPWDYLLTAARDDGEDQAAVSVRRR